mmetsp:Transcript_976/g.2753  ORF Transcript_976/g.2753 Transcript_976/m.2753 type:complete len:449 (-) Transcript_976:23-1369(-)
MTATTSDSCTPRTGARAAAGPASRAAQPVRDVAWPPSRVGGIGPGWLTERLPDSLNAGGKRHVACVPDVAAHNGGVRSHAMLAPPLLGPSPAGSIPLEGDLQPVLAVDELAARFHGSNVDFVEHALRAHLHLHGALHVPDLLVLGGHARAVEAWVEDEHGDALGCQLLGEELGHHVGGRLGHVVSVVAALGVLYVAPAHGAALGGDHGNLGALLEHAGLEQGAGHAQGAHGADIDHLQLLVKVEIVEALKLLPEVARIVDDNVHLLSTERGDHGGHAGVLSHVHARDNLLEAQGFKLRRGLAHRSDDQGTIRLELLHQSKAQALVGARHEHALARKLRSIVEFVNVERALVVRGFMLCESSNLVRHGVLLARRVHILGERCANHAPHSACNYGYNEALHRHLRPFDTRRGGTHRPVLVRCEGRARGSKRCPWLREGKGACGDEQDAHH